MIEKGKARAKTPTAKSVARDSAQSPPRARTSTYIVLSYEYSYKPEVFVLPAPSKMTSSSNSNSSNSSNGNKVLTRAEPAGKLTVCRLRQAQSCHLVRIMGIYPVSAPWLAPCKQPSSIICLLLLDPAVCTRGCIRPGGRKSTWLETLMEQASSYQYLLFGRSSPAAVAKKSHGF